MNAGHRSHWRGALLGAIVLGVAMPPAIVPGAEFLVLPGLSAWFALATGSPRPRRDSYLFGCVFMAWFSWSVRHVLLPGYLAIVFLGGLYFVLGTAALRAIAPRWRVIGFSVAVGATFWLRSVMPEIYYPHGQPCHCLWQWPTLLAALPLGGEPLCNALLGGLAGAIAEVWRSWRVGEPRWRAVWLRLSAWFAAAALLTLAGALGSSSPSTAGAVVRIAAIESGMHPSDPYTGLSLAEMKRLYNELLEQRLFAPTRALLAEPDPPDLILWPESSLLAELPLEDVAAGRARLVPGLLGAGRTRVVIGANVSRGERVTPAAFAIQLPSGVVLGHQEKQCLVPGGEFLPLVRWLPTAVSAMVYDAFAAALGSVPDCLPGIARPPLTTAAGAPFGVLLCYDNAFPAPAAQMVEAGAQFLCVVSNEAWYRGGAELHQLAAMTVCRAIELQTPIVRCTTDGWSLQVDAGGRVGESLPVEPGLRDGSRILRARVQLDPKRQVPMAWHRAAAGPGLAILLGLALLHGAFQWARLRVARTAP